jgi:hypothetical protein
LNAGTLVIGDSSSIAHNVAGQAIAHPEATPLISPSAAPSPSVIDPPSHGVGGGVMDLGLVLGAVCAPAANPNIHANSPDDCGSRTRADPMASHAP